MYVCTCKFDTTPIATLYHNGFSGRVQNSSRAFNYPCCAPEEVRHPCALRHYFYIPRPRSHKKLYIEYDFNYMKGARMSYLQESGYDPIKISRDFLSSVACAISDLRDDERG